MSSLSVSPDARPAGEAGGFELRRCRAAGAVHRLPSGLVGRGPRLLGLLPRGQPANPEWVEHRLEEVAGTFESYRRTGNWLDVGCGAGTLMRAARSQGWEVVGPRSRRRPRRPCARGIRRPRRRARRSCRSSRQFDVVCIVEVVEHVEDPRALVADAARLLRPGGALYVTTPHGRGISARLLRTNWSVVAPPEHLQLFSLAGLAPRSVEAGLGRGGCVRTP